MGVSNVRKDQLLARIDGVLEKQLPRTGGDGFGTWIDAAAAGRFRASGLTLLRDFYGIGHHHYVDFEKLTSKTNAPDDFDQARGLIQIVREEVAADWLTTTRGLIAGELFSDFLEMAQHLWDEKYKDAAAVIAGSSLEAHLRRLCQANGIDIELVNAKGQIVPKKADTLNAELMKSAVYNLSEQKQVTAWLGVRNDAAHGDYPKVSIDVVGGMIHGIRMFINRYPA